MTQGIRYIGARIHAPGRASVSAVTPAWETLAAALVNTYGATEVWALERDTSGVAMAAYVDSPTNDGTYDGPTLQATASPLTGSLLLTPSFDSLNDSASFPASGFFNGTTGGVMIAGKVSGAGVWTDGERRNLVTIYQNSSNTISLYKANDLNKLRLDHVGSGVSKLKSVNFSSTDWFWMAIMWDAGTVRGYIDFVNVTTVTGAGVVTGAAQAYVGKYAFNTRYWDGSVDFMAWWAGSAMDDADMTAIGALI